METPAPTPPWIAYLLVIATIVALWILGQTVGHVLLVFTISVVIALLLNPAVRMIRRWLRLPRGIAVLMVFLIGLGAIAGGAALIVNPVRAQVEEIQQNLPAYTDQANRQLDALQRIADDRGIRVDLRKRFENFITNGQERVSRAAGDLLSYSLDLINVLVTLIVILVCVIYMVLDAPRILRFARTIGGPPAAAFLRRTEDTLTEYVKAQVLVSLIIAVTAGWALWLLGVTSVFPMGATFAAAFTVWVFFMEFIPYVGPVLGAVPPVLLALITSPVAALWVIGAFLVVHQLEGHVVVPKIMGDAVGVHPLVVIFGLLVGEQLAGLVGMLMAIPVVVIVKELVTFAADHLLVRYPTTGTQEEEAMLVDLPDPTPDEAGFTPAAPSPPDPPAVA